MSSSLLHPPAHLPPAVALQISQQAPTFLQSKPRSISQLSITLLFKEAESAELWTTYEHLMLSCLRTGDEKSASICLERLTARFGAENERLMALKGLFQEATAEDEKILQNILSEYETILEENPSNMPVSKRRISLLRSIGKTSEAIVALNALVDASPTDAEAWAELGDMYVSQGMYQQGIFALEEVLLITPNAWNIHARLGEILYVASTSGGVNEERYLSDALRRYCRCIELCDDYLRGYYGLKLTTNRLLEISTQSVKTTTPADGLATPDVVDIQRLSERATAKLSEIVRRSASGENGWRGYDKAEIIAARELLDREAVPVTR